MIKIVSLVCIFLLCTPVMSTSMLGNEIVGRPSFSVLENGSVFLACRLLNGSLSLYDCDSSRWHNLGGVIISDPFIVVLPDHSFCVTALGQDHCMWMHRLGSWSRVSDLSYLSGV